MDSDTYRVAVYGTLRRGKGNHHLLKGQTFVGRCTLAAITLYDLGDFPGAKRQASEGVVVEVYDVDAGTMAMLDLLEDYHPEAPKEGLYERAQLHTPFGRAWVYLYNPPVEGYKAIRLGAW